MLEVKGLTTHYGEIAALRDAEITVNEGEVVGLIGPNGAGKTTLLNTVAGLLTPIKGTVVFDGVDLTGASPERLLKSGLALVPEHRRIFTDMTVEENLRIGGITRSPKERSETLEEMRELFPVLESKWTTQAGFLSGGEAQQLAIGRALMSRPRLLMMDEPSLGLAPVLVNAVFDLIERLQTEGRTLLVVEQNATRILNAADRGYLLRTGEVAASGTGDELASNKDLFGTFLGG